MNEDLLKRIELLEARVHELSQKSHYHDRGTNDYGDEYDYVENAYFLTEQPGPEGPWHIEINGVPACKSGILIKGMYREYPPTCHSKNYHDLLDERNTLRNQRLGSQIEIVKGTCDE